MNMNSTFKIKATKNIAQLSIIFLLTGYFYYAFTFLLGYRAAIEYTYLNIYPLRLGEYLITIFLSGIVLIGSVSVFIKNKLRLRPRLLFIIAPSAYGPKIIWDVYYYAHGMFTIPAPLNHTHYQSLIDQIGLIICIYAIIPCTDWLVKRKPVNWLAID